MERISSSMTFYYKRILPVMIFGFCGIFVALACIVPNKANQPNPPPILFCLFPLIVGVIIFVVFKKLVFDLMDEVTDSGEFLTVRRGQEEEQVFLTNIVNISYSITNPPRATILLRQPGRFGKEVAFCPKRPVGGGLFRILRLRNAIVDDLIQRVDAKRKI